MSRSKYSPEVKLRIARECSEGKKGYWEVGAEIGAEITTVLDWVRCYESEGPQTFFQKGHKHYPPEMKEAAVKEYLRGAGSLRDICRKYKIRDRKSLRAWIKVYNGHKHFKKQTGGSCMTKGRETTQAERIAVAKACIANGKNYGEAAIQFNISYQQARNWTLKYIEGGEAALEDRRGQRKKDQQPRTELEQAQIEIEQLKHKLKMLETENHLLKKLEEIERRRG